MDINRLLLQSFTFALVMFSLVGCGGASTKPTTSPAYLATLPPASIPAKSPTSTSVSTAPSSTPTVLLSPPSPAANAPISTLPAATFTAVPAPTPSDWPAANPNSLPAEYLVLYTEGAKLKSLPHRPVFDRPKISHIYQQDGESFGMFLLGSGPVASPDGRYVVLKAPSQGPPPPAPPTWLVDVESGRVQKLAVKGREAAGAGPVTWSPDGCCLTFVAEDTLYVVDVKTQDEPVAIFSQAGLKSFFARWSPTGEWIAVSSDANPQDTASAEREYIYWLVSPDGAVIKNLGQYPVAGYGVVPYNMDWWPDGRMLLTPGQQLLETNGILAAESTTYNPEGPDKWLPRAWTRSFLSQQFADGERPSFYNWSLSPGGRQIAYSLYDNAAQQSELYIFDRSTNSHRRVWTVSGYIINEIRWIGQEEFLVVGLGDPRRSIEGGSVILMLDTQEAGPPQVLAKGENLYLIDVIPNHLAAKPASTPTTEPPRPVPTPIPIKTGPVVDIPGSNYGVIELSHLDWPACCLTMAPEGERFAFATCHTMSQKIYVQNVDGSGRKEISRLRIHNGDGPCPNPAWSPDGRQLAFANYNYSLYVVNADGANLSRLEPKGYAPTWSPDGLQIAFIAHHYQEELAIGVMNRDGSNFRLLTNETRDLWPAWSPDGQRIAFESTRDGNGEIYVMNSDGSEQRRLTYNETSDWGPVWSPDGRHIVFTSDRNGHNEIYVITSDGANEKWLMDTDNFSPWPTYTTMIRFVEAAR